MEQKINYLKKSTETLSMIAERDDDKPLKDLVVRLIGIDKELTNNGLHG